MKKTMVIDDFIKMAKEDIDTAADYEMESANCNLAKEIYKRLFKFYDKKSYSGDVIFTWKSPSLVKDSVYVGHRDTKIYNKRTIGNLFPTFCTNKKYSLNENRNGYMGDFPHDYIDIYLEHVAKYAYCKEMPQIKEYYPLKRAILYEYNMKYFKSFNNSFVDFLRQNYLEDIWAEIEKRPFSDLEFDDFMNLSCRLMHERGKKMLDELIRQ